MVDTDKLDYIASIVCEKLEVTDDDYITTKDEISDILRQELGISVLGISDFDIVCSSRDDVIEMYADEDVFTEQQKIVIASTLSHGVTTRDEVIDSFVGWSKCRYNIEYGDKEEIGFNFKKTFTENLKNKKK